VPQTFLPSNQELAAAVLPTLNALLGPTKCQEEAGASSKILAMTLKVPVKAYSLKFLQLHLGKGYTLRQDDAFGIFLFILLQKNLTRGRLDASLDRYTATWEVNTCEHKLRKSGYKGLTNLTIVYFNNFVESVLKQEFHSAAAIYTKTGNGTIQDAIDDFMEKYDITPEDIDPMSLRRGFIRYRRANIDRDKLQIRRYYRQPK
jgi:hypothetical protein